MVTHQKSKERATQPHPSRGPLGRQEATRPKNVHPEGPTGSTTWAPDPCPTVPPPTPVEESTPEGGKKKQNVTPLGPWQPTPALEGRPRASPHAPSYQETAANPPQVPGTKENTPNEFHIRRCSAHLRVRHWLWLRPPRADSTGDSCSTPPGATEGTASANSTGRGTGDGGKAAAGGEAGSSMVRLPISSSTISS